MTNARPRAVLVLGRSASGAATTPPPTATLVVIAIGWPLSDTQQRSVEAARERARATTAVFDAYLVASPSGAATLLDPNDDVTIDASAREGRRIRKALGALSVRVAR